MTFIGALRSYRIEAPCLLDHPVILPAYSPDLNPIEQTFAKLKGLLRKAAEHSVEDLCNQIGKLLDEFTPQE